MLADLLGELDLQLVGSRADDVELGRGLHGALPDSVVGVAQDDRAEPGMEIDVLATVGIPHPTASRAREHQRWVEEPEAR